MIINKLTYISNMNPDSLRLFQTEVDYNAVKDSLPYPTASYIKDIDDVYYTSRPILIQPNYFYIEALADDMTVMLSYKLTEDTTGAPANDLEYSTDLSTWNTLSMNTASPAINTGEKIYLRGNAVVDENIPGIGQFTISQQCNVGGNVMSLLFNDDFEDKTDLTGYVAAFAGLFMEQPIVNASELILPATTLSMGCYYTMFMGCSSLTTVPALPALTLTEQCYNSMFMGCTSLTTAPELPAMELNTYCYHYMFAQAAITTAPVLPAITLAEGCYIGMFAACSNLNYVKMLATDISASACLTEWMSGVPSSGIFIKNPALSEDTIGRGMDGIPEGWTVVDA